MLQRAPMGRVVLSSGQRDPAQAQRRVYKLALEERRGRQAAADENIMPWLVERSARVLNRSEVGKVGWAALGRCNGGAGEALWDRIRGRSPLEKEAP